MAGLGNEVTRPKPGQAAKVRYLFGITGQQQQIIRLNTLYYSTICTLHYTISVPGPENTDDTILHYKRIDSHLFIRVPRELFAVSHLLAIANFETAVLARVSKEVRQ